MIDTRTKYRVVISPIWGYRVEQKKWYWLSWDMLSTGHATVESADKWIKEHTKGALRSYVDGE